MTSNEMRFNEEIELARQRMRDGRVTYWDGYVAGLLRAFFGAWAVSNIQHEDWLHAAAGDEALGYGDGYGKRIDHRTWPASDDAAHSAVDVLRSGDFRAFTHDGARPAPRVAGKQADLRGAGKRAITVIAGSL